MVKKIKKTLKTIAEIIFQSSWYPNNKILLESVPDLSSQTYPVFQYMIEKGLNRKYRFYWLVDDKNLYKDTIIPNVHFINYEPRNVLEKIQRQYLLFSSQAMMNDNRYIGKVFPKQLLVYLMHGACIKSRLKHSREDEVNESDLCICLSPFLMEYDIVEERIRRESFIISGYPRNDYLFEEKNYAEIVYPVQRYHYEKIVLWMPTFRQAASGDRIDSSYKMPLGIPVLYSRSDCEKVNDYLRLKKVLLVLKPHPRQDMSVLKHYELSNFVMLRDKDIKEAGIQLYQFVGSTDALITDYSSIYYDYLLTDKKIGITIDDIDVYSEETGFVFENPYDILVGKYMRNADDMITFIDYVLTDTDDLLEKRNSVAKLVHQYQDNRSTERTCNYIIDELEKRYGKR